MKTPRGSTGPTTDRGKQISSQNASKHHCTSTQLIVGDEDRAEFDALLDSLTAEYQPETEMQKTTVMQAARAVWHLDRVNREFDKSQQHLYKEQPNMFEWNAAQQAEFERMSRYRTSAERAHGRARQGVEALRKLRLQAGQRAFWENLQQQRLDLSKQRLQLSTARLEHTVQQTEQTQKEKEPKEKDKTTQPDLSHGPMHLSQEIEIRVLDGIVSYRIYPQAADMQQRADRADAGVGVLRCFEFPDGIPAEYAWVNQPEIAHKGIVWEQFFDSVDAWRAHVALESAAGPDRYLAKRRIT
jgi:hypothetical protein